MPDAAAISGHKRRRDEGPETPQVSPPDELSLGSSLTLSDTMIALRVIHAQFPKIEKDGIQPFVLKTQLYSSVKDRTLVDRQLELLKKERSICIFKLNTGQDDHAVMFMDDYLRLVERSMERVEVKDKNDLAVFDWFRTYVIGTKLDTGIGHHDLYTLLSSGGKVKDEHVSLLIKAGLLTRQLIDPNSYWFAIPSIGSILKGLSQLQYLFD